MFTTDEAVLDCVSQYDQCFEIEVADDFSDEEEVNERPKTADDGGVTIVFLSGPAHPILHFVKTYKVQIW